MKDNRKDKINEATSDSSGARGSYQLPIQPGFKKFKKSWHSMKINKMLLYCLLIISLILPFVTFAHAATKPKYPATYRIR